MTPHDQFKNNVSFPPKADINLLQLHRRKQSRGRRMSLRLSLALAVMFVAQVASADPRAGLGRDFESRYASMKAAMAAKDEMAIRSILASGFTSVDVSGKSEDAAHMITEVLALPPDPTRQSHTTILSVTGDGRTAVVKQRYEMTKTAKAPDGSEKSISLETVSTDQWVDESGSWRLLRTVTNQLDYAVDGVTIAHQVNAKRK